MSSLDLAASRHWTHVWLVKWTDTSQGYHFPCEKRFPKIEQAQALVDSFQQRERMFYSGVMASLCPFREVRMVQER